jgi:very-short-patch-repair endonuclease
MVPLPLAVEEGKCLQRLSSFKPEQSAEAALLPRKGDFFAKHVASIEQNVHKHLMSVSRARELRRRLTEAEQRIWHRLRRLRRDGLHFRRQSPIGAFVLDFECRKAMLAIELDGEQHREAEHAERDLERDAWLAGRGYLTLRFCSGAALADTDAVMHEIAEAARWRVQMVRYWRTGEVA